MKKSITLLFFCGLSTLLFAQKPLKGNKTAEVNLNFQTGDLAINYSLPAEVRFRYFTGDKTALRVRLGMSGGTSKSGITKGTLSSEITNKTGLGIVFTPGYEYHFEGTKKLSPYAGAQVGISLVGKNKIDVNNAHVANPNVADVIQDDHYESTSGSKTGLSVSLFMGADYYFTDHLFIGGEFGFGLINYLSVTEGEIITKNGSNTTTNKVLKSSTTNMFGVSTGGLRLGFVF